MVFSQDKWNGGEELRSIVKVASDVEWDVFGPILAGAFELFVHPLIEDGMTERLIQLYADENRDDVGTKLISLTQRAVANLGIWYSFHELNTILSNSGTQRPESDTYKSLYKYQERALREAYKAKGFNALDDILVFLEKHISVFTQYSNTTAYRNRRLSIVPDAETINQFIPIERSRLVYLRFAPHLQFIEQTQLPGLIGQSLVDTLKGETLSAQLTKVRELLRPVVLFKAAARLIRHTGSVTDRGLYFSSVQAVASGNDEEQLPADKATVSTQAALFDHEASEYLNVANRFVRDNLPGFYRGDTRRPIENEGRKAFWGL
jgi:hypothetical protein